MASGIHQCIGERREEDGEPLLPALQPNGNRETTSTHISPSPPHQSVKMMGETNAGVLGIAGVGAGLAEQSTASSPPGLPVLVVDCTKAPSVRLGAFGRNIVQEAPATRLQAS